MSSDQAPTGHFCWVDLAASDAERAQAFYSEVFGWTGHPVEANGGIFTRMRLSGRDIGSMYQLARTPPAEAAGSHWTPYLRVHDADAVARRVVACGGKVLVRPFVVSGIARIALILDAVGAQVGLWEDIGDVNAEKS